MMGSDRVGERRWVEAMSGCLDATSSSAGVVGYLCYE